MKRRIIHALLSAGLLLPLGLALNYALNVVLARLLPVEGFGLFGTVQSLTAVLAVVATWGFSQSMMRLTAAYVGNHQYDLLSGLLRYSLRLVTISAMAVAAVLALLGAFAVVKGEALLWSAALMLPLTIDVWREGAMRGLHRLAEAIAPRQVLLPLVVLCVVMILQMPDTHLVMGLFVATFLCIELVGLLRLRYLARQITTRTTPSLRPGEWLRISWPMAMTSFSAQVMGRWDIVVVGFFLGIEQAGLYTAAARTALLANLVLRVVNLIVGPLLAESYHTGRLADFRRIFTTSTILAAILGSPLYLAIMIYPEFILQVFGSHYRDAADLLRILATGQFVNLVTGPVALALNMSNFQEILSRTAIGFGLVGMVLITLAAAWADTTEVAYIAAGVMTTMNLFLIYIFFRHAAT